MEMLKYYTGFLPREISFLKGENDLTKYEMNRIDDFRKRAKSLYENASNFERQEFSTFLLKVLIPRNRGHSFTISGNIYDQGIFYRSPNGFECISGPARTALMPFLHTALRQDLPSIDSIDVMNLND